MVQISLNQVQTLETTVKTGKCGIHTASQFNQHGSLSELKGKEFVGQGR